MKHVRKITLTTLLPLIGTLDFRDANHNPCNKFVCAGVTCRACIVYEYLVKTRKRINERH